MMRRIEKFCLLKCRTKINVVKASKLSVGDIVMILVEQSLQSDIWHYQSWSAVLKYSIASLSERWNSWLLLRYAGAQQKHTEYRAVFQSASHGRVGAASVDLHRFLKLNRVLSLKTDAEPCQWLVNQSPATTKESGESKTVICQFIKCAEEQG